MIPEDRIPTHPGEILRREFAKKPELTMSELRQAVDTSRKYALPLFNYCDSQGLTTRKGDVRVAGPRLGAPQSARNST